MISSINKLVENFPYPNLTRIAGVPDYESLAELHTQSNYNSSSIESNLGEGAHGLLFLAQIIYLRNTFTATPFIILLNPGPTVNIPLNSTAAQITSLRKTYDDKTKAFI